MENSSQRTSLVFFNNCPPAITSFTGLVDVSLNCLPFLKMTSLSFEDVVKQILVVSHIMYEFKYIAL